VKCGAAFSRDVEDTAEARYIASMHPWCPTCEAKVTKDFMASKEYRELYDSKGNPREPFLRKIAKKLMLPGSHRDG